MKKIKRKFKLILIFSIVLMLQNVVLFAQQNIGFSLEKYLKTTNQRMNTANSDGVTLSHPVTYSTLIFRQEKTPIKPSLKQFFDKNLQIPNLSITSFLNSCSANYAENLPFFCKIEHNWGKKLPMPFKFRLGSVEYVDWLEGKGN
jgi:hypothetical protein